jgi:hypothetical protein
LKLDGDGCGERVLQLKVGHRHGLHCLIALQDQLSHLLQNVCLDGE